MYQVQTVDWTGFFERAKEIGRVSYNKTLQIVPIDEGKRNIQFEPRYICIYRARYRDKRMGQSELIFEAMESPTDAERLQQLRNASVKIKDNSLPAPVEDRLVALEARIAVLEAKMR